MAARGSRRKNDWEDLDVTADELRNITECLKKEEFRKLLVEYAEEVRNPENRRLYEAEITQLEKQRGVDVTFVNPEPGYVIKSSVDGSRKCFINVSKSEAVARPTSEPTCEEGRRGLRWSIPHTLAAPRDDLDRKNVRCKVFDVVFHPDTLHLASRNARFREMVNDTAMDAVEKEFKVQLDRKNIKFPKISYKGTSQPTVLRKKSKAPSAEPLDIEPEIYQKLMASYDESRCEKSRESDNPQRPAPPTTYSKNTKSQPEDSTSAYTTPKFQIKHQTDVDIEDFQNHKNAKLHSTVPKKLIVLIDLPLLKSASDASLDVEERTLSIKSEKPAKYKLELPLPYSVDPEAGSAKFDLHSKKLTVTLPVVRGTVPLTDNREDSGVDSDHSSPLAGSGDESPPLLSNGDSLSCSEFNSPPRSKNAPLVTLMRQGSEVSDSDDTALRTSESEPNVVAFMNPRFKYCLPAFTCNLYDGVLALTVNVKNVDAGSIEHRTLRSNEGFHVLLTSVGGGFFPVYYSLCVKIGEDSVDPGTLKIEPWDNNVVFTIALTGRRDLEQYYVGLDEEFMEARDLPTSVSLKNKFNELMTGPASSQSDKKIEVIAEGDDIVINITSEQLDSDDEQDLEDTDSSPCEDDRKSGSRNLQKCRSVSESSNDEMAHSNGSTGRSKGILKNRRNHGLSRSVSESSVDDSALLASSVDFHSDSVQEFHSESGGSSLKKTVRFNDTVSRQLYRSNSSILGQRKKNQRKMRNKKRANERRASESENSETDERDKYKVRPKGLAEYSESQETVKPILTHDRRPEHRKTANIEIEKSEKNSTNAANKSKRNCEANEDNSEADKEDVKTEFKNDLIFDLDM